jgi:hypothetical protein
MIQKYSATPHNPANFSSHMKISSRGGMSNGGLGTPLASMMSDGHERMIYSPRDQTLVSNGNGMQGTSTPNGRSAMGNESRQSNMIRKESINSSGNPAKQFNS